LILEIGFKNFITMNKYNKWYLLVFLCLSHFFKMTAQVYIETGNGTASLDLCTCTVGAPGTPPETFAIATGTNQNIYFLGGLFINEVFVYNPTTGITTLLASLPLTFSAVSMVFGPDGLIYVCGAGFNGTADESLVSINPITGIVTNLGELPNSTSMQGDLFFYNGVLYGLASLNTTAESVVIQIPINNPPATSIAQSFPDITGLVGGISVFINGVETILSLGFDVIAGESYLYQLDLATGNVSVFCAGIIGGDLGAPPNYVVPPCCANNAGSFQSLAPIITCQNQNIAPNHLGNEVLNPDAALSFILVADTTASLPGAIIQIASSPIFSFNPAVMTTGTTYFVAAVAAPGPSGSPNWSSSCIDLSYFVPVQWRPVPTVAYSGAAPTICTNGCAEFSLNFSGNFPVNLTWSIDFGSQMQSGVFSADNASEVLLICPSTGGDFPVGAFQLQFLGISDAFCTCP
jgi:hypothetical protein